jgi:membrane protease subunit HflK
MDIQYPDKKNPSFDYTKYLPQFILVGLLIVSSLWFVTGFYVVSPGEVGVVRRFGEEVRKSEPGLRYRIPWPVEVVNIVNIESIRRAEIGFRKIQGVVGLSQQRVNEEALMLTGDENIVEAQLIVQYQVKDPSLYLFRVYQPDEVLRSSTEVALRSMVGNITIDEILTVGREKVQGETQTFLQRLLDSYQTGLRVTEVRLQVVDPPDQVKDAFHEVVRAREDRERLINQAQGYNEDIIPKARGKAQQMIREAEAYREERVLRAQGDSERFIALSEEYQKAKRITRSRLYLEAMERVLSKVKKLIVDPKVTEKVLSLLPLTGARLNQNV